MSESDGASGIRAAVVPPAPALTHRDLGQVIEPRPPVIPVSPINTSDSVSGRGQGVLPCRRFRSARLFSQHGAAGSAVERAPFLMRECVRNAKVASRFSHILKNKKCPGCFVITSNYCLVFCGGCCFHSWRLKAGCFAALASAATPGRVEGRGGRGTCWSSVPPAAYSCSGQTSLQREPLSWFSKVFLLLGEPELGRASA